MLKRNLIANYLGQGWSALMGLAFIPLYIRYLGIEAYGLIGLFALLQTWLSLLDMGITPTLGREMSRFTGGSHTAESIRDLLRSIELIAAGIALCIAGGIFLGANWIATSWLQPETLPVGVVAHAFGVMGLVTAIRFMENVYRSSIIGLQRQVLFNVINTVMATIRGLGAVSVLVWASASIEAFFIWQGLVSIATLIVLAVTTYANLPCTKRAGHFSLEALRGVWRFSGGMIGITFLALLLTQVDKVMLSKLISLSEYGYYALSATIAGTLFMLVSPITQAIYPRMCEQHACTDRTAFIEIFHKGAQLVSVTAGSFAIVVILFSDRFLLLWTQDIVLSERASPLLSLLMLGNLLSGLNYMPYHAQLAHGRTALVLRINLISVGIFVPTILIITPVYGSLGAAWVWVIFTLAYVLVADSLMFDEYLSGRRLSWYVNDLLSPLAAGFSTAYTAKVYLPIFAAPLENLLALLLAFVVTSAAAAIASSYLRGQVIIIVRQFFPLENSVWPKN